MNRLLIFALLIILAPAVQAQTDSLSRLASLSLEDLLNVKVVTATGHMQKPAEAPATIQVITAAQIENRGYEQLSDVLRDVPGIDMIHLNGYAPTLIYFRGMYGAENLRALFMIDGIAENNIVGSNDMAGPAYSLHNVERIEIIWGPASALYGANAFGGVINIITKKGADIGGFRAEKGFGTMNTSVEKVSFGASRNRFDLAISGSIYSTDGPKFRNRDPHYTSSYVDRAYSINGTLSYRTLRTTNTMGIRAFSTPMGWGTFFNSPTELLGIPSQGNGNVGLVGLLTRDIRNEKPGRVSPYSRTAFIQNEFQPNDKFNLLSRLVYRETGTGEDSYVYLALDGQKLHRGILASHSSRVSADLIANYLPSANHKFSAGFQFFRDNVEKGSRRATVDTLNVFDIEGMDITNINSTFLDRQYDIRNNFGGYLQYILSTRILGKTDFTLGGRYDYNDYFGDAASPRIAVVNQPNDKLTLKFQYGKAFRAPTNTEIYQAPSNFKLKTEKNETYELNFLYALSKATSLQINGFHNRLKDVIILTNLSNLTVNKNPGEFRIKGIETRLDVRYSPTLSGFFNFTMQEGTGKNVVSGLKRALPGIAEWKGNLGLNIRVQDIFNINLIENWVGDRRTPSTSPYGDVAGYFLTHLSLTTRSFFHERVSASLTISNIFNERWIDPGFRTADGLLFSTVLEQPGRTGLFKVAVKL